MKQGIGAGVRRLAAALTIGAVTVLTGCGEFFTPVNNNPGSGSASFVYVSNAAGTIATYSLTSGALAALSGSPISLPEAPTAIVVSPNNQYLYVGTALGVFVYTIASDGTLSEGNDDTVIYLNQNGYTVQSMVVDSTSSWLIITYKNQTELDAVPLDPTTGLAGTLCAGCAATLKVATALPNLVITPSNTAIAVSLGTSGTEVIGFTASATTAPFATSATTIAPSTSSYAATAVASDPTSTYLYITEASIATTPGAGHLRMFKFASLGAELPSSPYPTGVGPTAILPDASNAYVYVANGTDNSLSGYVLDSTSNTLTAFASTLPTANGPIALAEDSSKSYIFAIGSGTNPDLWLYSFDATSAGTLDVGSTTSTSSTNPSVANAIALSH